MPPTMLRPPRLSKAVVSALETAGLARPPPAIINGSLATDIPK